MKEERLEHLIAMVLSRWMGGENLREATEDIAELARSYFESDEEISFRLTEEMIAQNEKEDMMFLMMAEDDEEQEGQVIKRRNLNENPHSTNGIIRWRNSKYDITKDSRLAEIQPGWIKPLIIQSRLKRRQAVSKEEEGQELRRGLVGN